MITMRTISSILVSLNLTYLGSFCHRRFQPFLALPARASEEDFTLIKLRMIKYSAVGRKAKTTWQVMSAQNFPGKSGRGTEISI